MSSANRRGVFVIGMHRSGTSMISRMLNIMGLYCGRPDDLLPPAADNPGGFWERMDVKQINDRLLIANDCSWSKVARFELNNLSPSSIEAFHEGAGEIVDHLNSYGSWVIKDPRNCLLFPLWRHLVEDVTVVFVYRDPLHIAQSLLVRNGYPELFSLALWEKYICTFFGNHRGEKTIVLNYDTLINSASGEIENLYQNLFDSEIPGNILKDVNNYINQDLDHSIRNSDENFLLTDLQSQLSATLAQGYLKQSIAVASMSDITKLNYTLASYEPQVTLEAELKKSNIEIKSLNTTISILKEKSELLVRDIEGLEDNRQSLEKSLLHAETEILLSKIEFHQVKSKLEEGESENNSLISGIKKKSEEISDLRSSAAHLGRELEIESGRRRIAQQSEKSVRSSISFRIGWLLTRPLGIPYEMITSSLKSYKVPSVFVNLIRIGVSNPLAFLRLITPGNLKVLFKALKYEYPNLILSNARKKLLSSGETGKTKEAEESELSENEIKLLQYIESIPIPELKNHPKVSIIITNHNGLGHLERLSKFFFENTQYPNLELIFVDNASTDSSAEFITNNFRGSTLLLNNRNESFSRSNNKGAMAATGDLLLFMNNDIVPCKGWLHQLVFEFQQIGPERVGSIGATLVYPKEHLVFPLKLQHRGISFDLTKDFVRPVNIGQGETPFDIPATNKIAGNTAACLLISKARFFEVKGFDESYIYGYEDVDLGLKLMSGGYTNTCSRNSFLFHYEFGTQNLSDAEVVRKRRLNNTSVFKQKWGKYIDREYWQALINGPINAFSQHRLRIGLIVTDDDPHSKAGDTYTAWELKISLENLGWNVVLIPRREGKWLEIPSGLQVVISLLDSWDPTAINCGNKSLIKIAWCRNWFDRWTKSQGFLHYDIILTSSKDSISIYSKFTHAPVFYFPLATNPERFSLGTYDTSLRSDYCFTGSYWNDERKIIDFLKPGKLVGLRGSIFGYNWERFKDLKSIYRGPLDYDRIRDAYASTKLLIDDANNATREWGSVNSRVFDALGRGTMVISNGRKGSEDIFQGLLPIYETEEELEDQIKSLVGNEELRGELVAKLQKIVLENHTYTHRAQQLRDILSAYVNEKSIVIKIPAPSWSQVHEWGDYHMALGLAKAFRTHSVRSKVQILPEWDETTDVDSDYVLVLRGLSRYRPKAHHINIMWNISHPDKVDVDEYNLYDHIFVSSIPYSEYLTGKISKPVTCLLQCTSPDFFYPSHNPVKTELLFVGNSRKVFRKIVRDLLPTEYDLSIYGTNWEGSVDEKYIKGQHIDNAQLHRYYSGARIVLNDHWDSMRDMGFISNRIFDALACGATVISDAVKGLESLFGDQVLTYHTPAELQGLISGILEGKSSHNNRPSIDDIRKNHSFEHRVREIINIIEKIKISVPVHDDNLHQDYAFTEIVLPPQHLRFMNEDDQKFREIGKLNVDLMIMFGLSKESSILDIGSGYGRLAYALHNHFPDFKGSYLGLDILKPHIDWCVSAFRRKAPHYQFDYQNISNKRYNPSGLYKASDYKFKVPRSSIDMITLFSVFTHMYEIDIVNYIGEIHRMLKHDGICICTFFLYDEQRQQRLDARVNGGISLKHRLNDHTRYFSSADPLHVISYNRLFVENLFKRLGFRIIQCREGNWAGDDSLYFQDHLIVSKI